MQINFYATLRQITGRKTVELPLPQGTTVRALLAAVIERYPAMRTQLLREDGELHGHVHVFINGRDTPFLEQTLETVLSADDNVDIFPAVGGG
jgi:molybdopterin synthase sulfur carrier subunit